MANANRRLGVFERNGGAKNRRVPRRRRRRDAKETGVAGSATRRRFARFLLHDATDGRYEQLYEKERRSRVRGADNVGASRRFSF